MIDRSNCSPPFIALSGYCPWVPLHDSTEFSFRYTSDGDSYKTYGGIFKISSYSAWNVNSCAKCSCSGTVNLGTWVKVIFLPQHKTDDLMNKKTKRTIVIPVFATPNMTISWLAWIYPASEWDLIPTLRWIPRLINLQKKNRHRLPLRWL